MNTIASDQVDKMGHYIVFIYVKNVMYYFDSFGFKPAVYGGSIKFLYNSYLKKKNCFYSSNPKK